MTVVTRFAPSPTGYLHIGSARTALFNFLYAKNTNGKFLLRIEDTDKERSTKVAKDAIINSLKWLDIAWDGEIVYQSERYLRHQEIAYEMVQNGTAYYCFSSQEEIAALREQAIAKKEHFIFDSPWRNADSSTYPSDIKPVIRLKAPRDEGTTVVKDLLQGDVTVQNDHLDDMVLLRSDGTPTYMLAVVVDDHDMGITHIIRGDDHLNNASRQQLIYNAMKWEVPKMVHIPLIHGPDGAKLSKRHGALGAESYKEMGYLPEALNNYLLRLGWSHGNDEVISREQAIKWFSFEGLGKSPARLDFNKMKHLNSIYLRSMNNEILAEMIYNSAESTLSDESKKYILAGMDAIKNRAELLTDLYQIAKIYIVDQPLPITKEALEIIKNADKSIISEAILVLESLHSMDKHVVQNAFKELAARHSMKIGELMHQIRPFITGQVNSPSVFEIIEIIGTAHSIKRLKSY